MNLHCSVKALSIQILICLLFLVSNRLPAESSPPSEPSNITDFSPAEGISGTAIVIRGTALAGVTSVKFNNAEAAFSILADTVTAIVPSEATTGPITITTASGVAVSADVFTVITLGLPTIAGFAPLEATAGASVQIEGKNLAKVTSVKFNGVDAAFSLLTGSLTAIVPPSASSGPITVVTEAGTAVSAAAFTVLQQKPPVIHGFVPASGPAGATVEIQGTDLENVTSVSFNGVSASFLSFSGTLRVTVPFNATSGPITVVTPAGSGSSSQVFTVTAGPLPVISSFAPGTGAPGDAIEIQGLYLRDVVSVQFNGIEATFTSSLFRPLTAVVPAAAITGPITVTTRAGAAQSSESFVVVNPLGPVIEGMHPLSARAGEIVQLHGTNLTGVVSVEVAGLTTTFIEFTNERLLVFVPANAVAGPVKVTTQTGAAISEQSFTPIHDAPPAEPPLLSIRRNAAGKLELSWQITAGFRLETSQSLAPPVQWTVVSSASLEDQGRTVVVLEGDAKVRFFRLAAP